MTKQEQIEENIGKLYNDISNITSEEYEKRMLITPRYCANKLFEKGYRKIDKDSVILTKEEYVDLSQNYVKEQKIQAVKEFAEKVKEKAISRCRIINYYELKFIETTIDELLQEYEVEENDSVYLQ